MPPLKSSWSPWYQLGSPSPSTWPSQVAQLVKNLPAVQEMRVWFPGSEDPLEKGMIIHSSVLAWRIHGHRSLVGYSPWGCKEVDMPGHTYTHFSKHIYQLVRILRGSLGFCVHLRALSVSFVSISD